MVCFCEMEPCCTEAGRIVVSASQLLLEAKYERAIAFGKYLDQHPSQMELDKELQRATTMYRMALANVLNDRRTPARRKRGK